MAKIGISPATFAASFLNPKHEAKSQSTRTNLKKDQLIKMVDSRFLMDTIRELFKAISGQLYTHHLIARTHRNRLYLFSGNEANKQEKVFEKAICDFLTSDRAKFFAFA